MCQLQSVAQATICCSNTAEPTGEYAYGSSDSGSGWPRDSGCWVLVIVSRATVLQVSKLAVFGRKKTRDFCLIFATVVLTVTETWQVDIAVFIVVHIGRGRAS